jgi:putative transposase
MVSIQQGLRDDGVVVSMAQLCRWFEAPRRSVYYRPTKVPAKVSPALAEPIKAMIEQEPSFGYRTVTGLLDMNKNTVQRIFQPKGLQVRKRGRRSPRIEAKISATDRPDERWSTDLCRVRAGRDGWLVLALVIDCYTRQLLGWQLSRRGKASTAAAALEQAPITRLGTLGRLKKSFLLRMESWSHGLKVEAIHGEHVLRSRKPWRRSSSASRLTTIETGSVRRWAPQP